LIDDDEAFRISLFLFVSRLKPLEFSTVCLTVALFLLPFQILQDLGSIDKPTAQYQRIYDQIVGAQACQL